MNYYIGLDLGTSSMKGLLTDADGKIVRECSENYSVAYPQNGWSEQSPEDWITALEKMLPVLYDGFAENIKGLSVGGQMHGLVILDDNDTVIRPCILWNDGRTEKQTQYLNEVISREKLSAMTGNIAFAGFTAPKILWVKENEPDNFAKIRKIMLPKDYLIYRLTGAFSTDYSDASGMLLLDVEHKCWSDEMCRICGISKDMLPSLHESYDAVGSVLPAFGLPDCIVSAGAGDNAAAAVGTGTVNAGDCNISLGTSGTVFIPQSGFSVDNKNALHSFCHANGQWHLMGCILTAASARKWWLEDILGSDDYAADEKEVASCRTEGLYFLPYLAGERSPHNDVKVRGAFIGLSSVTTKAQMSRAIMEGVAFALKNCLDVAESNGIRITKTMLCGGGCRSAVWRQILADILALPVQIPVTEQGPSYGAAMLAMVAAGEYKDVKEAAEKIIKISDTVCPDNYEADAYRRKYEAFSALYPVLKKHFENEGI